MRSRLCTVEECTEVPRARGYCAKHYSRWLRHGDPGAVGKSGRPKKRPHGSETRYSAGCRCAHCREAHRVTVRAWRRRRGVRPHRPAQPFRTLVTCLVDFGVPKRRIAAVMGDAKNGSLRILRHETAEAGTAEEVFGLHWGLWRTHGPFRLHCRCAVPDEVLASLEAA